MTKIAKREKTAIATNSAGAGFEDMGVDDISIPMISVLQSLSAQVQDGDPEGAKAGLLYNSVENTVFSELVAVPAMVQRVFIEWRDRDAGGGLIARHGQHSAVGQRFIGEEHFGPMPLDNGNTVVDTRYLFMVLENGMQVSMPFKSSAIKSLKNWTSSMYYYSKANSAAPIYCSKIRVATKSIKGPKGTYHVPTITPTNKEIKESLLALDSPWRAAAEDLHVLVKQGSAQAAERSNERSDPETSF